jgi:CDP-2,3-bis-(O-geranylgeranyl)-sn-glycerol synthase
MVLEAVLAYSWFIVITFVTNGSLFAGVFIIKKMRRGAVRDFLLTPVDMNKKFPDKRAIIGDHKPVAGIFIALAFSIFFSLVYRLPVAPVLPVSVFLGDIAGSFVKRRFGIKNGRSVPLLDQLNFFVAGYAVVVLYGMSFPLADFLQLCVITVIAHAGSNAFAYKIGMKGSPW